jgi:hypothetical protein
MSALPPALDRFGAELETAVQRDLGLRRTRRRLLRAAAVSAAAVAAAFGVLAVLPAGGPSVVERAMAALAASDDAILHIELRGEQRNPDGSVVTWRSESWQLYASPYTRRQVEVGPEGIRAETLTRGDTTALYDAQTNTIYVASREELEASRPLPRITVVSRSRFRKIVGDPRVDTALVVKKNGYAVVATQEGAKRLRKKRARTAQDSSVAERVVDEPFRREILDLLESGQARETGRLEVGGRDAIRIESPDGTRVYLVDASTYAPIEWTSTGNGGGVTLRFPVYEELPVNAESLELLDLEAQYPGARVERDPDAYRAAEARLFPKG